MNYGANLQQKLHICKYFSIFSSKSLHISKEQELK